MGGSSGGSSGGGGSSGAVDYPEYMKMKHDLWLTGLDSEIGNIVNPYSSVIVPSATGIANIPDNQLADFHIRLAQFDPLRTVNIISAASDIMTGFAGEVDYVNPSSVSASNVSAATIASAAATIQPDVISAAATVVQPTPEDTPTLSDLVGDIGESIADSIDENILASYEAGMRNIGAAYTTSFILGRSNLNTRKYTEISAAAERIYGQLALQREQAALQREQLAVDVAKTNAELRRQINTRNAELSLQAQQSNAELDLRTKSTNAELTTQARRTSAELDLQAQSTSAEIALRSASTNLGVQADAFMRSLVLINDNVLKDVAFREAGATTTTNVRTAVLEAQLQQLSKEVEYDVKGSEYWVNMYQNRGNLLASIAGTAVSKPMEGPSSGSKAVSGALAGAAAGTMIGGPGIGTAIGGAVGLAGSFL